MGRQFLRSHLSPFRLYRIVIIPSLNDGGILPSTTISSSSSSRSGQIRSPSATYSSAGRPSLPGVLPGLKDLAAERISPTVRGSSMASAPAGSRWLVIPDRNLSAAVWSVFFRE